MSAPHEAVVYFRARIIAAARADVGRDMHEAAAYYGEQARDVVGKVGDILGRAKDAFDDAFKGARR